MNTVTNVGANPHSHKTAITRKKASTPCRWLEHNGFIEGRTLDFGCGKGTDADYLYCERYDPYYFSELPSGQFNTILCTYVLNVLLPEQRTYAINHLLGLLAPGGTAYITVRRDIRNNGWTKAGTYQEMVELDLKSIRRCASYEIYELRK